MTDKILYERLGEVAGHFFEGPAKRFVFEEYDDELGTASLTAYRKLGEAVRKAMREYMIACHDMAATPEPADKISRRALDAVRGPSSPAIR